MFDYKGSKSIFNKAELDKIIIQGDNITIAYREGYEEEGKFISVGSDHIDFVDDNFINKYSKSKDKETFLQEKIAESKVTKVEEVDEIKI